MSHYHLLSIDKLLGIVRNGQLEHANRAGDEIERRLAVKNDAAASDDYPPVLLGPKELAEARKAGKVQELIESTDELLAELRERKAAEPVTIQVMTTACKRAMACLPNDCPTATWYLSEAIHAGEKGQEHDGDR